MQDAMDKLRDIKNSKYHAQNKNKPLFNTIEYDDTDTIIPPKADESILPV